MSGIYKSIVIGFILFLLCAGCFFAGILYHNRTDGDIGERDNEYREQQQKYDEQIATSTTTISNLADDLREEIYISTRAVGNLQELLTEIRKQKIDL